MTTTPKCEFCGQDYVLIQLFTSSTWEHPECPLTKVSDTGNSVFDAEDAVRAMDELYRNVPKTWGGKQLTSQEYYTLLGGDQAKARYRPGCVDWPMWTPDQDDDE